jgi:hypothetical protein
MSLIESESTNPKDRIWCSPCYGKGLRRLAEHDLDSDRPLCDPCKRGVLNIKDNSKPTAAASASSSTPGPSPQPGKAKEVKRTRRAAVPKDVGSAAQTAHICECKPDCKVKSLGKYARGHYPRKVGKPSPESNGNAPAFSIELLSPNEYNEKYKVYRYAAPDIIALIEYVDSMPFDKVAVIKPNNGETPGGLCDRIRRTFDKWFSTRPYQIDVGQENKQILNHVRITKIKNGTVIRKAGRPKKHE